MDGFVLEIVLGGNSAPSSVEINHPDVLNLELIDLEPVIYTNIQRLANTTCCYLCVHALGERSSSIG